MRVERVGGALKAQDAARVLVDEQKLVGKRGKALAHAGDGEVVRREMRGREARRHAERRADMERQRRRFDEGRFLLAVGIGELVAPERAHVEPDIAEHAKAALEAFAGIPLALQVDDVAVTLVAQLRLQRIADALDVGAILLREIEVLQRGVDLHEAGADPPVERLGPDAHSASRAKAESNVVRPPGDNKNLIPAARSHSMKCASLPTEGVGRRYRSGWGCGAVAVKGVTPRCTAAEPKRCDQRSEPGVKQSLEGDD